LRLLADRRHDQRTLIVIIGPHRGAYRRGLPRSAPVTPGPRIGADGGGRERYGRNPLSLSADRQVPVRGLEKT